MTTRDHPLRRLLDASRFEMPTEDQLDQISTDPDIREEIVAAAREIGELHSGGNHAAARRLARSAADVLEPDIEITPPDRWSVPDEDLDALAGTVRARSRGTSLSDSTRRL